MDQHQKRKLENELLVMGLAKLDSPELIEQMAMLVERWPGDRHEYLRDLLNECEAAQRTEMYEALVGKFRRFKPLSLAHYETEIALRAGALVAQKRARVEGEAPKAIMVGGEKYVEVSDDEASHALVTLTCQRCWKSEQFVSDTAAGAMILGRQAGWKREAGINKEVCPECQAKLPTGVRSREVVADA